jgi:putative ABC transport system permease protein
MSLWRDLTHGLRRLIHRNRTDHDIADEVEHYLEQATSTFEQSGLSPEEARRAARLELGNVTAVREQIREYGWENVVDTVAADLRYGVRRLCGTPGFTVAAALTLALGIGACTAIFSAVNPILLEPLPYPDAGRLTMIWDGQNSAKEVTFGTYREVVERNRFFESIAVMKPLQVTLTGAAEPERINGQLLSGAGGATCTRTRFSTGRRQALEAPGPHRRHHQ